MRRVSKWCMIHISKDKLLLNSAIYDDDQCVANITRATSK